MNGVALRCPKCGTTQNHTGECDACYDDQVRYFCSNHSPGLWLDEPVCKECGAKFGEAPRRRPVLPAPAAPPVPTRKPRQPELPRPMPRRAEPPPTSRRRPPDPEVTPAEPSLEDLLGRIASGRRERTGYRDEEAPSGEPAPEVRLPRLRPKGCLVKLVLVALLLLALFLGAPFFLVGGVLQFLLGGLSQSIELVSETGTHFQRDERFKELSKGATAILISHQFSSVRGDDRTVALVYGTVEATDTDAIASARAAVLPLLTRVKVPLGGPGP